MDSLTISDFVQGELVTDDKNEKGGLPNGNDNGQLPETQNEK
jgi:hypothetical protein